MKIPLTDRTIKQISTYARSGCHLCSMLSAEIQGDHSWSSIDNDEICRLEIRVGYSRYILLTRDREHSICLSLCPVTERMHQFREPEWYIESTKPLEGLDRTSVQLLSTSNIGHRTIPQIRNWLRTCQREHTFGARQPICLNTYMT